MAPARILIVEDESIVALDIQQRLVSLGYEVVGIASTGLEAIEQTQALRPDLVLMDIWLKGKLNGIEAAATIYDTLYIPVIYLTAYSDHDTLARAKFTQPFGYILKPFEQRELQIAIDMALYKHRVDQRLRENEEWLYTTLRSIGDAVIVTDDTGRIKFMNGVAEQVTGWHQAEAIGRDLPQVFRIINGTTRQPALNPVENVLQTGKAVGLANDTILVCKDGREISIDDNAAPIINPHGKINGVVLVFRDITRQRQTEMRLRESEARFRSLFENSLVGIFRSTPAGRFILVNQALADMLGYTLEEMLALQLPEDLYVDPSQRERIEARYDPIGLYANVELLLKKKNGEHLTTALYARTIHDEVGTIVAYEGLMVDMTEQRRVEQALQRSREDYRTLLELLPYGIEKLDLDGYITYSNAAHHRLLGYEPGELIGKQVFDLIADLAERAILRDFYFRLALEQPSPAPITTRNITKDGRIIDVQIDWNYEHDTQGQVIGYVSVISDITGRKLAEQQALQLALEKERVQLIADFLKNVSHEFRTPLSTIYMNASLLENAITAEYGRDLLRGMTEQADNILRLVDMLVMMSRLDAGTEFQFEAVNLRELLFILCTRIEPAIQHQHLTLHFAPGDSLLPVWGDAEMLAQALTNLLDNAIRYTPAGGEVTVSTYDQTGEAVVAIRDTGVGIRHDLQERIFERFYRVDAPHQTRGFGLGLAMAKKIIEGHSGRIELESQVGLGSTFRVILPLSVDGATDSAH